MTTTSLPQELTGAILQHFDPVNDRNSLISAALVSTEFTGPAQAILFRSLYLDSRRITVDRNLTFERALNLFSASPHLSSYMRNLTLVLPPNHLLAYHTELELLLPKCISVRRLVFKGAVGLSWDTLTAGLQSAMSAFFRRAVFLEKLHILHIAALPQFILEIAAHRYSVLSFHRASMEEDDGTAHSARVRPSRPLAHLILSTDYFQHGRYQGLMSALTGTLRRLTVEQTSFTNGYVRTVGSTLTELSLDCTHTSADFTLPPLPQLTTMELKLLPNFYELVPRWLPETLAVLLPHALPLLRTLFLHVVIEKFSRSFGPETTHMLADLDAMTGSLSRCVWDMVLNEERERAIHGAYYRTVLESNLVRLREADLLEISYSVPVDYEKSLP
ncbi:hypothetical protein C8R45DRAFT_1047481 [Mycena sanguinolenta]|nr:hypothetical protein C8R45DRAFT_1047481 [Mycena sanguinolenta]